MAKKGKDDDIKIKKVGETKSTNKVKSTEAVSDVEKVKGASAVSRVAGVSGVGAAAGVGRITLETRDKLMSMVTEEAAKLAAQGIIPKGQREVVEQAVRMVIEASLADGGDDKKR